LTTTLADASLAAYIDYERHTFKTPNGYTFFGRFTGWDDWLWNYGP
jgi:hypothetical protein